MKVRQWLLDEDGRVVRVHESHDNGRTWVMLDPSQVVPVPGGIYARHPTPSATGQVFETLLEKVPDLGDPVAVSSTQSTSVLSPGLRDATSRYDARACIVPMCGALAERDSEFCSHHESIGDPVLPMPTSGHVSNDDRCMCAACRSRREQLDRVRRLDTMQRIEAMTKAGAVAPEALQGLLNDILTGKKKTPTPDTPQEPEREKLQRRIRL